MKTLRELRTGNKNYSSDMTGGEYKHILLDEIKEVENIRASYDNEGIKELAASIEQEGLLQPIIVMPYGQEDDRTMYKVIAGHRRYAAFKYLRSQQKPTYNSIQAVVKKTISDIDTIQLIENIQREELSPSDMERAVKSILKKENISQAQLAKRLGKSKMWVTRILGAEKVRSEGKKKRNVDVTFNEIPTTILAEVAILKDKKTRKKAVNKIIKKKATQRAARVIVKEYKDKLTPQDKANTKRIRDREAQIKDQIRIFFNSLTIKDKDKSKDRIIIYINKL